MRTLPHINIKFLKLFKRIIAPRRGVAPRFASLPDGVGEGAQASLVYGDGSLSNNPDISHSMTPL